MFRKLVLNGLYITGTEAALAPYLRGMGSIIMLHRVQNLKSKDFAPNTHLSLSPEFLDKTILSLKTSGYEFISMDELAERVKNPSKYSKAKPFISITLDDGYRDNLTNAVPVFRRHQVPYMIYIAPALTEAKAPLWWEELELIIAQQTKLTIDLPEGRKEFDISTTKQKLSIYDQLVHQLLLDTDQYLQREIITKLCKAYCFDSTKHTEKHIMNWKELGELLNDPLCSLGAHTINHFALSKLSTEDAFNEIKLSVDEIKSKLGHQTEHFAYPYGFHEVAGKREFDMAKELGFLTATTTRHGVIYSDHKEHITALPRVSMNGNHQSVRYVDTLLSGVPTRLKNLGKKLDIA